MALDLVNQKEEGRKGGREGGREREREGTYNIRLSIDIVLQS